MVARRVDGRNAEIAHGRRATDLGQGVRDRRRDSRSPPLKLLADSDYVCMCMTIGGQRRLVEFEARRLLTRQVLGVLEARHPILSHYAVNLLLCPLPEAALRVVDGRAGEEKTREQRGGRVASCFEERAGGVIHEFIVYSGCTGR